ncbi:MAG: type IV secretory system conjugative DNA transfer family protein [Solirubrobacteraceae bacterium]
MNRPPAHAEPPRRPYWLAPVLVVLLVVPHAWAIGALIAAGVARSALWTVRRARARRGRGGTAPGSSDSTVLGSTSSGEPIRLSDRQLSAHGLILGASGAGKSTTLLRILTDHVRRGRPVIAIDMKGSPAFASELARAAAESGRPFQLWTPDGPGHWNPLQHGNATELKDKLIATERFTEPHYQRAAERYVQTVLQVLQAAHPARAPTIYDVVRMMDPRSVSRELRNVPRLLADRVQDYVGGLTPDQISAIRGLGTRLAILSESHTGQYLDGPGVDAGGRAIDVRSALAGHEVVLFSLNSSTYGKLSAQLGTLVIQDLVAAVGHRLGLPEREPALIGIDEFSGLGGDHVIALLARGREADASLLLATQELADLDRAARGLRDQVLGNTAVKIVHRQDVPASAQTIAQMAGTETAWEQTYQVGRGALLGRYDTGRGTRRQVEQFVVHPNEIKALPTGRAVLITKLPTARARTVRVAPPRQRDGPELG